MDWSLTYFDVCQDDDLKKEICKLESFESFHADFARTSNAAGNGKKTSRGSPQLKPQQQQHKDADGDEGHHGQVSVKDLCRKTR